MASRLEGATKQFGVSILISSSTKNEIGADFLTRELDSIRVVGKKQPVTVYELCSFSNEAQDPILEQCRKYYSVGLNFYRKRDWKNAYENFKLSADLGDKPSSNMSERCEEYLKHPPPADWDTVHDLTRK